MLRYYMLVNYNTRSNLQFIPLSSSAYEDDIRDHHKQLTMLPPGSRRCKIRPPRRFLGSGNGSSGENSLSDYESSWQVLSNAIKQIQNKNVSSLSYEQLYRKAYMLVLRKFGGRLYDDVGSVIKKHLLERRGWLLSILKKSSTLHSSVNEDFLKALLNEWEEHLQAMQFISDVLMYLNRVYVKEQKRLLIYDLGIQLFKDNVIKQNNNELGDHLIQILVEDIKKSRMGEYIDTKIHIKKIINMLELLLETDSTTADLQYGDNYYQAYFEPALLKSSEDIYHSLAQDFSSMAIGTKYIYSVNRFIKDEESRIDYYLPSSTHQKLIDIMNNILIRDRIDSIMTLPYEQEGLSFWLNPLVLNLFDQIGESDGPTYNNELNILYNLVGRIEEEHSTLKLRLKENIIQQGKKLPSTISGVLKSLESVVNKSSNAGGASYATIWVETIIKYQSRFSDIVKDCFKGDNSMGQCITLAIREFINSPTPSIERKLRSATLSNAPELLSIYIDQKIKQFTKQSALNSKISALANDDGGALGDSIDSFIDKAIIFLRFIKDKDAFEAHYANHFAKRYLNSKGKQAPHLGGRSDVDIEELMIKKLGEELGTTSLDKIIKMNKDMRQSKDLTAEWKTFSKGLGGDLIDLELKICNVSDWPKSMTKDYKKFSSDEDELVGFIWPRHLRDTIKPFEEFWHSAKKNENKTLYWCPKFGSMEMKITYPSRTYDITMSTYAGIIMLLFAPQSKDIHGNYVSAFDENRELSYAEIKELTGIPEVDLKRHLQSIAVAPKLRLLVKIPMTKEVNETDVFRLNNKFKAPSTKVKVLTVSASSSNASKESSSAQPGQKSDVKNEDQEEVSVAIREGRKIELNAAIVRIMKSRRSVNHNELITEIIKQLTNRFQPLTILMKQRIEDLIEKEYMRRDSDDRNVYHYIA